MLDHEYSTGRHTREYLITKLVKLSEIYPEKIIKILQNVVHKYDENMNVFDDETADEMAFDA